MASDATDSSVESDASDVPLVPPDRLKVCAAQTFELAYVPSTSGVLRVGGVRVLLVEDRLVEDRLVEDEEGDADAPVLPTSEPRVLKEWEVVAEVWVKSCN